MIGETLSGKYEIVRQLGEGGMGAVYEARRTDTGEHVAVKVISSGDLAKDKALVTRFHREAKAAAAIDTKHIVRLLETGTDAAQDRPFMVMEYLVGEDLGQLFHRIGAPLPPDLVARIGAQCCLGLEKAHEARVVHRDIKPANVFLAKEGGEVIVKILDFGIAKIKMDQAQVTDTTGLTRTGSMLGSPIYMSPEQARGSKSIDHRADVWSLGVVLYQMLAGKTPCHDIEALGELIIAICSEPPRSVQELAPWVTPELAAIVHGALRLDPGERFQTVTEMYKAMEALLPDGHTIVESMMVPVSADQKMLVAPKLTLAVTADVASARPVHTVTAAELVGLAKTDTASSAPVASSGVPSLSTAREPSRIPMLAGAVVVAAALGALGVYKFAAPRPAPPPPVVATTTPPAATPTAPAPPTAPPAETKPRLVKVVVLPPEASVEVDGKSVKTNDGIVDIEGTLGSLHKVKVTKGGVESVTEVAITEAGAVPPKIKLEAPKTGGGTNKAKAPEGTPPAKTGGPSATPFKDRFE